jgi:hypothetical protein
MDLSNLHEKIGKVFYHLGQLDNWGVGEAFEITSFEVHAEHITFHGNVEDGTAELDSRVFFGQFGPLSEVEKAQEKEKDLEDFENELRTDPKYR